MALVNVTISGNYTPGKTIKITPVAPFGDEGQLVPDATVTVTANASTGAYSTTLKTSDVPGAYVRYMAELHTRSKKLFDLTDDTSPISLDELFNAYDGAQDPSAAVTLLDHEARIEELELNGGGGGGGGSIPFINEAGTDANISLTGGGQIPFLNEAGSSANIPLA